MGYSKRRVTVLGVSRTTSRTEQISRTALRILIAALDLRNREWEVEGDSGPSLSPGKEDEEHGTAMVDPGWTPIGGTQRARVLFRPHTTLRGFRGRTAARGGGFLPKATDQRRSRRVGRVPCSGRDPGKLHGAPGPSAQGLGDGHMRPLHPCPVCGHISARDCESARESLGTRVTETCSHCMDACRPLLRTQGLTSPVGPTTYREPPISRSPGGRTPPPGRQGSRILLAKMAIGSDRVSGGGSP